MIFYDLSFFSKIESINKDNFNDLIYPAELYIDRYYDESGPLHFVSSFSLIKHFLVMLVNVSPTSLLDFKPGIYPEYFGIA